MSRNQNNYHLTPYELETIINFNEEEDLASVYTYNKLWIKRLNKLCDEYPEKFMLDSSDLYGKFLSMKYKVDKNCIGIIFPEIGE